MHHRIGDGYKSIAMDQAKQKIRQKAVHVKPTADTFLTLVSYLS